MKLRGPRSKRSRAVCPRDARPSVGVQWARGGYSASFGGVESLFSSKGMPYLGLIPSCSHNSLTARSRAVVLNSRPMANSLPSSISRFWLSRSCSSRLRPSEALRAVNRTGCRRRMVRSTRCYASTDLNPRRLKVTVCHFEGNESFQCPA